MRNPVRLGPCAKHMVLVPLLQAAFLALAFLSEGGADPMSSSSRLLSGGASTYQVCLVQLLRSSPSGLELKPQGTRSGRDGSHSQKGC